MRRLRPPCAALLVALAVPAAMAGCGSSDKPTVAQPAPAAPSPQAFPRAGGEALPRLFAGIPQGPTLEAGGSVFVKGSNRVGFALFDRAGKQMRGVRVALYTATITGTQGRGPFPARSESLATLPRYRSQTTANDPDAVQSVYVAKVPLRRNGRQALIALALLDGRVVASSATPIVVGGAQPPRVGQRAPRIHTPTAASVGGDLSKIDTRIPPDDMHDVDYAHVLGRKPIVIVFATPALCQSRVCGPAVDEVAQVKARYGERAAFIHMEVYRDNNLRRGYRPQLLAFGLRSEPWVFTIDRRGRVAARIEGAASVAEIEQAVRRALS